jgi:hypothetical protein
MVRASFLSMILLALLWPVTVAAQPSPPPPATASATQWANWINSVMPQAVPQETITLGTFDVTSATAMSWNLSSRLTPQAPPGALQTGVGPAGAKGLGQQPTAWLDQHGDLNLLINSYNVQYQLKVSSLAVVQPFPGQTQSHGCGRTCTFTLTLPALTGTEEPVGASQMLNPNEALLTWTFHPKSVRPQVLRAYQAGAVFATYKIIPHLTPQLGAFVVPYLPVAIVYEPPGCGQCAVGGSNQCGMSGSNACGSCAIFTQGTTIGTTLSWGTSTATTKNPADLLGDIKKVAGVVSFGAGLIPGGQSVAKAADTIGSVADALKGLSNTPSVTQVQGTTQSRGWSISLNSGVQTHACQSDLYFYLQNVLFVYALVLKDPASGNISPTGEPTVELAAIHYDAPAHSRLLSQLQSELPPAVVAQFLSLRTKSSDVRSGPGEFGGRRPRLIDEGLSECTTETDTLFGYQQLQSTSSESSTATITTTTTNVPGFLGSIGMLGGTTQSVTYSTSATTSQGVTKSSELVLYCPEYLPAPAVNVHVYLDTLFGTLLATLQGAQPTSPPKISGTAPAGQLVMLRLRGRTYRVVADAGGKFTFRSTSIAKGSGVLTAGNAQVQINYTGVPLTNLDVSKR